MLFRQLKSWYKPNLLLDFTVMCPIWTLTVLQRFGGNETATVSNLRYNRSSDLFSTRVTTVYDEIWNNLWEVVAFTIICFQDEDGNNVMTGTSVDSVQTNYLNLDSTLTKSDDVFTCLVEVTPAETAIFSVPLNTFSKFSTFYSVLVFYLELFKMSLQYRNRRLTDHFYRNSVPFFQFNKLIFRNVIIELTYFQQLLHPWRSTHIRTNLLFYIVLSMELGNN